MSGNKDIVRRIQKYASQVKHFFEEFQGQLNFDGWENHPHYNNRHGIGRSGLIGLLLGVIGGVHLTLFACLLVFATSGWLRSSLLVWCLHIVFLVVFHVMEFLVTSIRQPHSCSTDSFIVNHSFNYTLAIFASFLEYWLEILCFGSKRLYNPYYSYGFFYLGLFLVLTGQAFRSIAMWQCGTSFNHMIDHQKPEHHQLQTSGLYHYLRHPSYFGWFYWSIGMQLLLGNVWCFLAYFYVSWLFFYERIPYEERVLVHFYGEEYVQYIQRTVIGIPFVSGYVVKEAANTNTNTPQNNRNPQEEDTNSQNNTNTIDNNTNTINTGDVNESNSDNNRNGREEETGRSMPMGAIDEDDEDYYVASRHPSRDGHTLYNSDTANVEEDNNDTSNKKDD